MKPRRYLLAIILGQPACAADTSLLEYDDLVPVTVRIEDYQDRVSLLFSTRDGHLFDLEEVDAPAVLERDVPRGSSVSVHFEGENVQGEDVLSIADLDQGDDVTLRPLRYRVGSRTVTVEALDTSEPLQLGLDFGCGGAIVSSGYPFSWTIDDSCASDPFHLVLSLLDGEPRSIATLSVPLADTDSIVPPPIESFREERRRIAIAISGLSPEDGGASLVVHGMIGRQEFGIFDDVVSVSKDASSVEVELDPLDFEALSARIFIERDGGDYLFIDALLDPAEPVLDARSDLPAVTAADLSGESVVWRGEGTLASTDFTYVQYGAPLGGADETIRAWFVVRAPAAEGRWQLPELPAELERWRPPAEDFAGASVAHYDLPGLDGRSDVRRDVFPYLYRRAQPGSPRVVVSGRRTLVP